MYPIRPVLSITLSHTSGRKTGNGRGWFARRFDNSRPQLIEDLREFQPAGEHGFDVAAPADHRLDVPGDKGGRFQMGFSEMGRKDSLDVQFRESLQPLDDLTGIVHGRASGGDQHVAELRIVQTRQVAGKERAGGLLEQRDVIAGVARRVVNPQPLVAQVDALAVGDRLDAVARHVDRFAQLIREFRPEYHPGSAADLGGVFEVKLSPLVGDDFRAAGNLGQLARRSRVVVMGVGEDDVIELLGVDASTLDSIDDLFDRRWESRVDQGRGLAPFDQERRYDLWMPQRFRIDLEYILGHVARHVEGLPSNR